MTYRVIFLSMGLIMGLVACSGVPQGFVAKGSPESLISSSQESVRFDLTDQASIDALMGWVGNDMPTRAELSCIDADENPQCQAVIKAFQSKGISIEMDMPAKRNAINLIYERVVARECQPAYQSNHSNSSNHHYTSFGCTTALNMVQSMADYSQITRPKLKDFTDAEMAVKTYRRYQGINDPYYPY